MMIYQRGCDGAIEPLGLLTQLRLFGVSLCAEGIQTTDPCSRSVGGGGVDLRIWFRIDWLVVLSDKFVD